MFASGYLAALMLCCELYSDKMFSQAVPFMRDINPPGVGGRIINVSSCGGYSAGPSLSIYNTAKFGVYFTIRSLRCDTNRGVPQPWKASLSHSGRRWIPLGTSRLL